MDSERVRSETAARTYTPAGHKLSAHGIVFHEQYQLLCACRSLASGEKKRFTIACEFEEAGKFDDLVYFHNVNGVDVCEMVQYKHSTADVALNLSSLLSDSNRAKQYSLVVYFNSYLELYYSKWSDFERKYKHRINSCVLLTNRSLDKEFIQKNMDECTSETKLFCTGKSYRFKQHGGDIATIHAKLKKCVTNSFGLESKVIDTKTEEFLNKFVLSVENEQEIEAKIREEIETCLRNRNTNDEKIIKEDPNRIDVLYKCLFNRIFDFHSNSEVIEVTREDLERWLCEDNKKIGEDVLSVYHDYNMNRLAVFGTDLFTDNSIEKLKNFVEGRQENMFCIIGRGLTVFALLKLVQVLKLITKRFHVILEDQFLLLSDDQATIDEYLIVRCESLEQWNDVIAKARLDRVLGKKIVFVTSFGVNSEDLCRFYDETRCQDLGEDARRTLDSKTVSFQGCRVSFSVLDISGVEAWIDERVLDGVFREILNISRRFDDDETECFVERRVGRRNRIDLESFRSAGHEFVIENMTESEYECFIAEERFDRSWFHLGREEEFKALCRANQDRSVSLLYHAENKFYWKKGHGESIEQSISEDLDPEIDLNDVTRISDQTVLIVAEPGMGKSNLLSVLLDGSVENRPDVWIVKIDLSGHTGRFCAMQENHERFCAESAIEFLVGSESFETSFESRLFRTYFRLEGKLIVLVDGFDEIAPDYRETVLELIRSLKSIPTIRLWVTSRPQERDYLENRLGLMSYSMVEFSVDDQKVFFTRFWIGRGCAVDDRAIEFIDRLLDTVFPNADRLLTGIPLQCRMLGEVYRSRFEEFRRSENVDPVLPDAFDILDLYEEFVRKIFDRYVVEKLKMDATLPGQRKLIKNDKKVLYDSHKLLSLEIVFPRRFETTHAAELNEYKKRIFDGDERTGIVHSLDRDNRPVFIHKTIAEYFAALWCYDILKKSDRERDKDLFDRLEEMMFEPRYEVFRGFFDRLSVRSSPALRRVLNGRVDVDSVEIDSCFDDFHRNALHLAASYRRDSAIDSMIRRGVRVDSRDSLFEWTPLQYGLGDRSALVPWFGRFRDGLAYDSIESLLPGNEEDRTMFERITDRKQLLLNASQHGHGGIVKYLLKHGTVVDVTDKNGSTALHLAARKGHDGVCATLIEYGSRIGVVNDENATPLYCAYREGHESTVALLIGADADADVSANMTSLHYACVKGDESVVALELEKGVHVNAKGFGNRTSLHYACARGNESIVTLLLDHGADTRTLDSENNTPLHSAWARHHVSIVELLLKRGADANTKDSENNVTLLHWACSGGNESLVTLLLERGAHANTVDGENMTPLHLACFHKHVSLVKILLEHGVDVEAKDSEGMTPLHWACARGDKSIVTMLLEREADVNVKDSENMTPLHYAFEYGRVDVVDVFVARDADVLERVESADTLLHAAVASGRVELVATLLGRDVNVNARDRSDRTPLDVARHERHGGEIVELLLEKGAHGS